MRTRMDGRILDASGRPLYLSALQPVPTEQQQRWCADAATRCHEADIHVAAQELMRLRYVDESGAPLDNAGAPPLQLSELQASAVDHQRLLYSNCKKLNVLLTASCPVPRTVAWIFHTAANSGGSSLPAGGHFVAYLVQRLPNSDLIHYEYFDSLADPPTAFEHVFHHAQESIGPGVAWLQDRMYRAKAPCEFPSRVPKLEAVQHFLNGNVIKSGSDATIEPMPVLESEVQRDVTMCGIWCLWYVRHRMTMLPGSVQVHAEYVAGQKQTELRAAFFRAPSRVERLKRSKQRAAERTAQAKRKRAAGVQTHPAGPIALSEDD